MSRLYQHRKKQNNNKIIFLILIVAMMIFVIFMVGFDSLINSTMLFTNIFRSDRSGSDKKSEEAFYGSVDLDMPNIATNAATIIVSGQATGFDIVDYYLNNVKTETTKLEGDTLFSKEIGRLKVGKNKIHAVARTKNGKHTKKTKKYTILYKRDAPSLQIDQPKNNETVHKQDVAIIGTTDRNTTVHLNNSPIVVDLKGEFVTSIRLKEGENILDFTATDIAGNTAETTIRVTYERDD